MKRLPKSSSTVLQLLVWMLCCAYSSYAQDSKKSKDSAKAAAVAMMIESKSYVFNVESVRPMKGGTRHLSPGNTMRVSKDSVVTDLPYFGKAYQASMSSEGGIKFTSTQFEYSTTVRKKGGWDIAIKPKDGQTVLDLTITVFDNGTAHLDVNSSDRQPISYSGYIAERK